MRLMSQGHGGRGDKYRPSAVCTRQLSKTPGVSQHSVSQGSGTLPPGPPPDHGKPLPAYSPPTPPPHSHPAPALLDRSSSSHLGPGLRKATAFLASSSALLSREPSCCLPGAIILADLVVYGGRGQASGHAYIIWWAGLGWGKAPLTPLTPTPMTLTLPAAHHPPPIYPIPGCWDWRRRYHPHTL